MEISGWGRFPTAHCLVAAPRDTDAASRLAGAGRLIARGNGRAYGDSALNRNLTLDMKGIGRMIAFDPATGVLTAEAGVILGDVIAAFLPRGWFPAVTPGTKLVTIGGMIAADVHGKNHHKHGSFASCVEWLDLALADGTVQRCSRSENSELFEFTLGGMGLTGVILRAAIRLTPVESAWIRQQTIPAICLDEAIEVFERSGDWTYSVAWIDCLASGPDLGRSLVMLGEHATRDELDAERQTLPFRTPTRRRRKVPLDAPAFALNRISVRMFNELYYRKGKRAAGESFVDWDSYFYPLDAILDWNRIYGRRGFAQFQCVLPLASSREGMAELLKVISAAGAGSFLAVLKRMGPQESRLSFPMEGYTLALDFPVSEASMQLLERLDAITLAHGGRFYLAKDSRMRAATLEAADPRIDAFRQMRHQTGAAARFTSLQSERLGL